MKAVDCFGWVLLGACITAIPAMFFGSEMQKQDIQLSCLKVGYYVVGEGEGGKSKAIYCTGVEVVERQYNKLFVDVYNPSDKHHTLVTTLEVDPEK